MDPQAASQREQTFTATDRARIREALLAYAKVHRIGVPTLRVRISQATGRTRNVASGADPYLVDQKTLQRFLKDTHRTNDAFIVPLALFVSSNEPQRDDVEEFAIGAGRFMGVNPSDGLPVSCGLFSVLREKRPKAPVLDHPFELEAISKIELSALESGGIRATEQMFWTEQNMPPVDKEYRMTYEGIAFERYAPLIIFLRNALTGYPRSFWFYRFNTEGEYYGFCSMQLFEEPKKARFHERRPDQVFMRQKKD